MKWRVGTDDVAKGKLVKVPGWYTAEIANFEEQMSKDKESTNAVFDFRILAPGDKEHNGIVVRTWFSEKAPGMSVEFLKALGAEEKPDGSYDVEFGKNLVGKKIRIEIKRGEYNGKPTNNINGYDKVT